MVQVTLDLGEVLQKREPTVEEMLTIMGAFVAGTAYALEEDSHELPGALRFIQAVTTEAVRIVLTIGQGALGP